MNVIWRTLLVILRARLRVRRGRTLDPTAVGGIPDLVQEGETGFLVPTRNPKALAAALGRYAAQPQLARQHGARARVRVEQHYSMAAMLSHYLALYDRLVLTKTTPDKASEPCAE